MILIDTLSKYWCTVRFTKNFVHWQSSIFIVQFLRKCEVKPHRLREHRAKHSVNLESLYVSLETLHSIRTASHRQGCLNNPIFSTLEYVWHFSKFWMSPQIKLWPTSVSHLFFFLNTCLGPCWSITSSKNIIPMFGLSFKIMLFQASFLIYFFVPIFSLHSSGWVVIAVCGSNAVQGID